MFLSICLSSGYGASFGLSSGRGASVGVSSGLGASVGVSAARGAHSFKEQMTHQLMHHDQMTPTDVPRPDDTN